MENKNLKELISTFEDLTGKMKDAKDFNILITNILKKKKAKNKCEIIIQFIENISEVKAELKTNKKLDKTIFSILLLEKGEEKFINDFLTKLEDRQCSDILLSLKENSNKLSKYGSLISNRLNTENNLFIEKFQECKTFEDLFEKIYRTNFTEENTIHHFLNFWNNSEKYKNQIMDKNLFEDIETFKKGFLAYFKNSILNLNYSKNFIEEIKKKKMPKELENVLLGIKYESRIKIDAFLTEYRQIHDFKKFLDEIFSPNKKLEIILNFFELLEIFKTEYDKERYKGTIFESLFFELKNNHENKINLKIDFYFLFANELCLSAHSFFKKNENLFKHIKSHFSENPSFVNSLSNYKRFNFIEKKNRINFIEEIAGNSYEIISNNLLLICLDDNKIKFFEEFLKEQITEEILNFLAIDDRLSKYPPLIDLILKSKDYFIDKLLAELLKNQNFKKQKILILNSLKNYSNGITKENKEVINDLKEEYDSSQLKKIKHIYSRYLAFEFDLFYLLDFFSKNDFEKLSLIANRLIRSYRYTDALSLLLLNDFNEKFYIEKQYENELFEYFYNPNFAFPERKNTYTDEVQPEDFFHDNDYNENFNEFNEEDNFDNIDIDADSDEESIMSIQTLNKNSTKSSKRKKRLQIKDYILTFKYNPNAKLNKQIYFKLAKDTNLFPLPRNDLFFPMTKNSLVLDIPIEKVFFIDNLKSLENLQSRIYKKLAIDIEYAENTISLIQISDGNNIFLIDYLRLIQIPSFFITFQKAFKNCSFLAFDFSGSDLKLLSEDFKDFFSKEVEVEDLKKNYENNFTSQCLSLSDLTHILLEKPLCKYYQCSNWEKRPLLKGQIHYAALDAHILFKLSEKLAKIYEKDNLIIKNNECEMLNYSDFSKKEIRNIKEFAKEQVRFLEAERKKNEDSMNALEENTIEVIFYNLITILVYHIKILYFLSYKKYINRL